MSAVWRRGWHSMESTRKLIDADLFLIIESLTFNIRKPYPAWFSGRYVYQLKNNIEGNRGLSLSFQLEKKPYLEQTDQARGEEGQTKDGRDRRRRPKGLERRQLRLVRFCRIVEHPHFASRRERPSPSNRGIETDALALLRGEADERKVELARRTTTRLEHRFLVVQDRAASTTARSQQANRPSRKQQRTPLRGQADGDKGQTHAEIRCHVVWYLLLQQMQQPRHSSITYQGTDRPRFRAIPHSKQVQVDTFSDSYCLIRPAVPHCTHLDDNQPTLL
jgi:hypothetical protein